MLMKQIYVFFYYQPKKVPNRSYGPNLALCVKFGHKYYAQRFRNTFGVQDKFYLDKLFLTSNKA